MNSHISAQYLKIISVSFVLMLSLTSCSVFKSSDYVVKDSLYVWSESFDESAEANKVVTEYQTIKAIEESIPKSDVQLIFDAMVNNEIAETDLTLKTPKILDTTTKNNTEIETNLVAETATLNIESVEAINRLTQENPSAAGIPVDKVLPEIKKEVADVPLANEILRLAGPTDYQLDKSEYGMWQLVKNDDSQYQEVCSLSSSTLQLEDETYFTQVWLKVVGNDLLVNSTTNIDIRKPRVGVKFDNGSLQRFNKNYFQTSAVWSGDCNFSITRGSVYIF